jgi:hypothetical protein
MLAHRQLHAIRLHRMLDCTQSGCVKSRIAALRFALQDGALTSARSTLHRKSERACPCLHKHSLAFHSIAFAATATATRRSRCYHNSNSVSCYHTTLPTNNTHNSIYHNTITNILPQYYQHTYNPNTITMFPNYLLTLPQYYHIHGQGHGHGHGSMARNSVFAKVGLHAIRPCTIWDCTQLCVYNFTYI